MDYDDIDVNMLDNRDSFGVVEKSAPRIQPAIVSNFFKKPSAIERIQVRRELTESKPAQSKFARKARSDEDQAHSDRFHERKSESKKTIDTASTDFRYRPAVTFQEKLSVLEDRDRHLRETTIRDKNMNIIAEGTCPDMCPERERLLREVHCFFSIFEGQIVQNEMHVVPELLVKEYARSSADQEEPLPHELRPEPVLMDTMSHLLMNIIPKIEEPNVDVAEWYNFCWDRLRSLRKDIIQQQLCSTKIVELLEQSARFHICCFDRLFDCESGIFDVKINAENLVNCLQMLITMYEDLEAIGVRCVNECEFRTYMMLLLLDSNDLPGIPNWHDEDGRRLVQEVTDIYFAFKLKLGKKFFKLVKKTNYLNTCILQRFFTAIRSHTLNTLVNAYSPGSQVVRLPLTFVKKMLEIDDDEEAISFVTHYGFGTNYETNEIQCSKSSFSFPETKLAGKSSYIVESKRVPILEAVTRTKNYRADRKSLGVHSSFGENDILQKAAWNADDQRAKVVSMYGDIYQTMQHSTNVVDLCEESMDDEGMRMEPEDSAFIDIDPPTPVKILPSPSPSPVPPPSAMNVFNFGTILPKSKIEDVVDADCELIRPATPSPLKPLKPLFSPKLAATNLDTVAQPSPTVDKFVLPWSAPVSSPPIITKSPPSISMDDQPEPASVPEARKPDEIVSSLTNALNQFEQVYWDYFGVTESDRLAFQRQQTLKENRKLRRVVKNSLKRIHARKAARIWWQKVENRRKREESFVGITHVPPEDYVRLWGKVRPHDRSSLVEEMLKSEGATKWSRSWLNTKAGGIKYVGRKLADNLINAFRRHPPSLVDGELPLVTCWKAILAISDSENALCRAFIDKVREFSRVLFYENEKNELGSVERIATSFNQMLVSVHVKSGSIQSVELTGTSNLIIFTNELWESCEQFKERVTDICENLSFPIHVSVIVIGDCSYRTSMNGLLNDLSRSRMISAWSVTTWRNFLTIPQTILKSCQHAAVFPPFRVKNLKTFVESVGYEFFSNLDCLWADRSENSPVVFIDLYNKFLLQLEAALERETPSKFNVADEFLPHIVGCENARTNVTNEEVPHLITNYSLISFTKWPPNSVEKMIRLLRRYCEQIGDTAGDVLLPSVLRLLDVDDDDASVELVDGRAPWIKIVELWFRHRLQVVSMAEDANRVFIFYDADTVGDVADGLWIEKSFAE